MVEARLGNQTLRHVQKYMRHASARQSGYRPNPYGIYAWEAVYKHIRAEMRCDSMMEKRRDARQVLPHSRGVLQRRGPCYSVGNHTTGRTSRGHGFSTLQGHTDPRFNPALLFPRRTLDNRRELPIASFHHVAAQRANSHRGLMGIMESGIFRPRGLDRRSPKAAYFGVARKRANSVLAKKEDVVTH